MYVLQPISVVQSGPGVQLDVCNRYQALGQNPAQEETTVYTDRMRVERKPTRSTKRPTGKEAATPSRRSPPKLTQTPTQTQPDPQTPPHRCMRGLVEPAIFAI